MAKDGPPSSSSGHRFGARAAMKTGFSPKATNPQSVDPQARQALADFAAYYPRTKSIGKPLPIAQGVSDERAASLRKSQESERSSLRLVAALQTGRHFKLDLLYSPDRKSFYFRKIQDFRNLISISQPYSFRESAMRAYRDQSIFWLDAYPITSP